MDFAWLRQHAEAVLLIVITSIIMGLAAHQQKVKSGKLGNSLSDFLGELLISGCAGWLAGMALIEHAPLSVTLAASGTAAHMGTRFVYLADQIVSGWLRSRKRS